MSIKNIIFDFGGVLIDWNPEYLYSNIFKDKQEIQYFLTEVCNSEWNLQLDAGRKLQECIDELIEKFPQYKNAIIKYRSHWIDMIGGEIIENTSLIKILKNRYRLFGLTNWSSETFPLIYNRYSFFADLEGIVVSGEEKVVKPNRKIYELLLSRYNLIPEQSLFIDDNAQNIAMAKEIGFQVIHFCTGTNLKDELSKLIV
ncbi:MAG: HAD family hydrolase [Desulfobulbia bacterium]